MLYICDLAFDEWLSYMLQVASQLDGLSALFWNYDIVH